VRHLAADPIAVLRAFFAPFVYYASRSREPCPCRHCAARRIKSVERDSAPRKPLGAGDFGVRPTKAASRFRETVWVDLFNGRPAGGHPEHAIKPMPKPSFLRTIADNLVISQIKELVSCTRIPKQRVGDKADYRQELEAQALLWHLEHTEQTARQCVDGSIFQLKQQYRELANSRTIFQAEDSLTL
jgi:hypothetical protein